MNNQSISRTLLWVVCVAAVIGGLGMYRYFRIAPELRFAEIEARWHAFTALLLALMAVAVLLRHDRDNAPPS